MTVLVQDPTQWFPMTAALVTSQPPNRPPNLMGIGYIGFMCWRPPILCLGMNSARYSGEVIRQTREFVAALPDPSHVINLDYCGFISGVDCDKFQAAGLTPVAAEAVGAPLVLECPLNLECKLREVVPLGSHDLFIGEVVKTHLAEAVAGGEPIRSIILQTRRYLCAAEFLCDFGVSAGSSPAPAGRNATDHLERSIP